MERLIRDGINQDRRGRSEIIVMELSQLREEIKEIDGSGQFSILNSRYRLKEKKYDDT